MITTFTLNIVLSAYREGHFGDLSNPGLLNFGKFETINYQIYEIPLFMLMGMIGGLLGALWNHVNYKISCFRMKCIKKKWVKVLEVLAVAVMGTTMGFLMIFWSNDCQIIEKGRNDSIQLFCEDGKYNVAADLWFQTPEKTVQSLLHDAPGKYNAVTLIIFVILYFFLAAFTFGLSMSSGLFIPSLLIGAGWGRLMGSGLTHILPSWVSKCIF